MLRKLIAYDFQCVRKTALLLLALSLGIAVVASLLWSVSFGTLPELMMSEDSSIGHVLLMLGGMLGGFFTTLGAFLSASAVIFVIGIHYYKKFVSDEAYLTFTLPATPGQHLASKLITGGVWMGASFLVMIVEMLIIFIPMFSTLFRLDGMDTEVTNDPVSNSEAVMMVVMLIGYVLVAIAATANQISLLYFSLTMGGVVVNKNKALAGVGIYFLAEFLIEGIVQGITTVLAFSGALVAGEWAVAFLPYMAVLVYGGFAVGFSFVNKHMLTHKLNLA